LGKGDGGRQSCHSEERSDEESQYGKFRDSHASGFLAALGMTTFADY
jgi:hypothetical protein